MLAINNQSILKNKLFLGTLAVTAGFLLTLGALHGFALPESNLRSSLSSGDELITGARDSDNSNSRTGNKSSSSSRTSSTTAADPSSLSLPQTNGSSGGTAANTQSGTASPSSPSSQPSAASQPSQPSSGSGSGGSSGGTPHEKPKTCIIDIFGVRVCFP